MVALLVASAPASAEQWHAGLNLRADSGAHAIRAGGGIELSSVDLSLVLDPMFWTDGQHDLDLLARVSPRGWGFLGGWRTTVIGIADGAQLQHKLLVGISAPLPDLGPLRTRWAFELATVLVKHGAGLPAEWISFETGRDFVDLINFGMFVTVEYAGAL